MSEFVGFPVSENHNGHKVVEVVPDRVVAIIEPNFVTLNSLKYPYDDGFKYDSVIITKEQLAVLARQVSEMKPDFKILDE